MAADDNLVFSIDEGFGNRLKVWANESDENGGGGFVEMMDPCRDAIITIDFAVWDRIVRAVAKSREK